MIIAPSLSLSGHCNKLRLKEWNGSLWLHLASNILHIEWNYIPPLREYIIFLRSQIEQGEGLLLAGKEDALIDHPQHDCQSPT